MKLKIEYMTLKKTKHSNRYSYCNKYLRDSYFCSSSFRFVRFHLKIKTNTIQFSTLQDFALRSLMEVQYRKCAYCPFC